MIRRQPGYRAARGSVPAQVNKQALRTFAPADIDTLISLPEIEVKYRLLRNEWLTLHSRLKQAEERVFQAERSRRQAEIEDARTARAKITTELGQYRRLALLCQARATAEVFFEIAHQVLPRDARILLDDLTEETLQRPQGEMGRPASAGAAKAEDYALLDELLKRWGPLWREGDAA